MKITNRTDKELDLRKLVAPRLNCGLVQLLANLETQGIQVECSVNLDMSITCELTREERHWISQGTSVVNAIKKAIAMLPQQSGANNNVIEAKFK